MTTASQPNLTQPELDRLQRLRASVLAFQRMIGSLPADEQKNNYNEQFNQLHAEAKALLKEQGFDKRVAKAITEDILADRNKKVVIPRLSAVVIFGVILALAGLGVNSIVLEDVVVNSLACVVSSGGMLLVVGALGVLGATNLRRQQRLTNLGDLYLRCDALLYQIDHTLNTALPNFADRPAVEVPEIPSVVELALDSLDRQVGDWQQKLTMLEEQRLSLGSDAPLELMVNIDFVQRELNRVRQEIDRLNGRVEVSARSEEEPALAPTGAAMLPALVETDSEVVEKARSNTKEMPAVKSEEAPSEAGGVPEEEAEQS